MGCAILYPFVVTAGGGLIRALGALKWLGGLNGRSQ
jgi:hypothetical protein